MIRTSTSLFALFVVTAFAASSAAAQTTATRYQIDPGFKPEPVTSPSPGHVMGFPVADGSVIVRGSFNLVDGVSVGPLARVSSMGKLLNAHFASSLASGGTWMPVVQQANSVLLVSPANGEGIVVFFDTASPPVSLPTSDLTIVLPGAMPARLKRASIEGIIDPDYELLFTIENGQAMIERAWNLPDGRVLLAGNFTKAGAHVTRDVAVLMPDGSIDTRYVSTIDFIGPNALGSDGRFVGFPNPDDPNLPTFAPVPPTLVRLDATGSPEETWLSPSAYQARAITIDTANRILVAFERRAEIGVPIAPDGDAVSAPFAGRPVIQRFETGSPGSSIFYEVPFADLPGASDPSRPVSPSISGLHSLADGGVVVVGILPRLSPQQPSGLLKITAAGTPDLAFTAPQLDSRRILNLQKTADGWLASAQIEGDGISSRSTLIKLEAGFARRTEFVPDLRNFGRIHAAFPLPDDSVLLQGTFAPPGNPEAQGFVKMLPSGAMDYVHVPRPTGLYVTGVTHVGSDARIYVSGPSASDLGRSSLERFSLDGTRDSVFGRRTVSAEGITAIHVDGQERILLGGYEREANGRRVAFLQRLLPSGERDDTFLFSAPESALIRPSIDSIAHLTESARPTYVVVFGTQMFTLDENGRSPTTTSNERQGSAVTQVITLAGSTFAAGRFQSVAGVYTPAIALLDANGMANAGWRSGLQGGSLINVVQTLPDGRLLISGQTRGPGEPSVSSRTHAILTRDGLVDLNEDLPTPLILSATASGALYGFNIPGAAVRLQPHSRPSLTIVSEQPSIQEGETIQLEAAPGTGGAGSFTWFHNGIALDGETRATLDLGSAARGDGGVYSVRYVSNTGEPVFASIRVEVNLSSTRISNASARSFVGPGTRAQITGFVVEGRSSEAILMRSIRGALSIFGVQRPASSAGWDLYIDARRVFLGGYPSYQGNETLPNTLARTGAFPVADVQGNPHSLITAMPGFTYAFHHYASESEAGVSLNEIYMPAPIAGALETEGPKRLVNFSCRAEAGEGERVLIVGFVIEGNRPLAVLIHGLGPTLHSLGVDNSAEDPTLTLYQGMEPLLSNDDWNRQPNAAVIAETAMRLNATRLIADGADAALLAELAPGAYTAILQNKNGGSRVGMIEIYDARP